MVFVVRPLHELAAEMDTPLFVLPNPAVCGLSKLPVACHRESLPSSPSSTTACEQPDGGECSDMFDAEKGSRRRCALATFSFNMRYTAGLRVAEKRRIADTDTMFSMV